MSTLKEMTDKLWCCSIKEINHDYREACLKIKLVAPENDSIIYDVNFVGVISLLWTMDGVEEKICRDVYPELTSIEIKQDISLSTENKWLKHFPLNYNVAIEIMDRALIINANVIEINGNRYNLKENTDTYDIS